MQKFVKVFSLIVILGGGGLLVYNLIGPASETPKVSQIFDDSAIDFPETGGDWGEEDRSVLESLPREVLARRAFIIERDFLYFYYAILESRHPEIARKTFESGFAQKCFQTLKARIATHSKEDFLRIIRPALTDINFEKFVADATNACLAVLYQTSPKYLSPEELQTLKSFRFLLTADEAAFHLKNSAIRAILERVSPGNLLLTNRFSTLLASRKVVRPPVPSPEAPALHEPPASH